MVINFNFATNHFFSPLNHYFGNLSAQYFASLAFFLFKVIAYRRDLTFTSSFCFYSRIHNQLFCLFLCTPDNFGRLSLGLRDDARSFFFGGGNAVFRFIRHAQPIGNLLAAFFHSLGKKWPNKFVGKPPQNEECADLANQRQIEIHVADTFRRFAVISRSTHSAADCRKRG